MKPWRKRIAAFVLPSVFGWTGLHAVEIPVADAAAICAAMKHAAPGDTLVMRDGAWTDQQIVFQGQGEAGRPITLRAASQGAVILGGTSQLRIGGQHLVVEGLWFKDSQARADLIEFRSHSKIHAENCVLRQSAITGGGAADSKFESRWVSLYGKNNAVESCYFAGKTNGGATLVVWVETEANHHRIYRNHFGPRPPLGRNGGETIRVGDSATAHLISATEVDGNLFERCNGEVEIVSNKSCENVYRGNTFLACEGALTFRHGQRGTAEENFFLGQNQSKTGGIRVVDEGHRILGNYFADLTGEGSRSALTMMNGREASPANGYFQVRSVTVADNLFVDCRSNFVIGLPDSRETLAPTDCLIRGNVVQGRTGPLIRLITPPQAFVWQGNRFFGAETGLESDGIDVADPHLEKKDDGLWRAASLGPRSRHPLMAEEVGPDWLSPLGRTQLNESR